MKTKDGIIFCSFCGTHRDFVELLIAGPPNTDVHICDDCIDKCTELIQKKRNERSKSEGGGDESRTV